MTATITLSPTKTTTSTLESVEVSLTASNNLNLDGPPRIAPAFIRADEAYYWTFHWQHDVRESMNALSEGEYQDFDSDDPNDVVRWMLGVDDDC
jgi:hypothetical protein